MHSVKKFLSETCITLLYNYYRFRHNREGMGELNISMFIQLQVRCFAKRSSLWVIDTPYNFFTILFRKGAQKEPKFRNFTYLKVT